MIVKGIVQCPYCEIRIQAFFQRSANSLLCPNCQEEIGTEWVIQAQPISLPSTKKSCILTQLCSQWLRSTRILRRERPDMAY